MNALQEIKNRFKPVLDSMVDDSANLLTMIRPAKDGNFGDYQVNCAMTLKNVLGKSPRDIAADIVDQIKIDDLCQNVEVAGPGFINLTLDNQWLNNKLSQAFVDECLAVSKVAEPKTYVVDFSSPNVAKPMHVGHIRSTVIGDAISKILRYVGHNVISDNHIGDWGTQFGMIIYGYKNFVDSDAYQAAPVAELGRLYKYVRMLIDYHDALKKTPEAKELLQKQLAALERVNAYESTGDKKADKQNKKDRQALNEKIKAQKETIEGYEKKTETVASAPAILADAQAHPDIGSAVLIETAKLHAGDETNLKLWNEFLPYCREDMQRIYDRLNITFDHELGESFYHNQLAAVAESFKSKGLARESEGALCVFMDDFDTPMIIQKKDGAFLYATTDLATIKHRIDQWNADAILYVVDFRQHEHFDKLFAAATKWGYKDVELNHVSFGTVLGEDGKPIKTRAGDAEGLEGLLDEAESHALVAAKANDLDNSLSQEELDNISKVVGLGGLKYIDLSQNRSSDYKFSYDKMLALKGNTATYLQYSYARVQGIFRKGNIDVSKLRANPVPFILNEDVERKLALNLSRFSEALEEVLIEYKPNILANYLFELTQVFFQFYDQCPVVKVGDESLKQSRLQLCDLTARTIRTGLSLLGIQTIDKL